MIRHGSAGFEQMITQEYFVLAKSFGWTPQEVDRMDRRTVIDMVEMSVKVKELEEEAKK